MKAFIGLVLLATALSGCSNLQSNEGTQSNESRATSSALAAAPQRAELVPPVTWGLRQTLTAEGAPETDGFGRALAVSGDTLLVGALNAAYVFVRVGNDWVQQQKLTVSDPSSCDLGNGWSFSRSVALSGDSALLSCPGGTIDGVQSGSVYAFVRSGSVWSLEQELTPENGANLDVFGDQIALEGDTAVIGATGDDEGGAQSGAAYVFVRTSASWSQQAKLRASNARSQGDAVALSGDTALVKDAQSSAHVFVRVNGSWSRQATLAPPPGLNGNQQLGKIALVGDLALLSTSAEGNEFEGINHASTEVFERSGSSWSLVPYPSPSDPTNPTLHGGPNLALSQGLALLGGEQHDGTVAATLYDVSGNTLTKLQFMSTGAGWTGGYPRTVAILKDSAFVGVSRWLDSGMPTQALVGGVLVYAPYTEQRGACTTDGECVSQHCVEGVCCDATCEGGCESCLAAKKGYGRDGVCEFVSEEVREKCGADTCELDNGTYSFLSYAHECNFGVCKKRWIRACGEANLCRDGACVTSCATSADCNRLNGYACVAGSCAPAPPGEPCSGTNSRECGLGSACVDGACSILCLIDCKKFDGYGCVNYTCVAAPPGTHCSNSTECARGNQCVDGVCCDSRCDGPCMACDREHTGQPDGTCAPIPVDEDPDNECEQDGGYPESCGADGTCDGAGACGVRAKAGTTCGDTTCDGDDLVERTCDDRGVCRQDIVQCVASSCLDGVCSPACASNDDCSAEHGYCSSAGYCAKARENGAQCGKAVECQSTFCVDGVCCESACDGQCAACDKGGSGVCVTDCATGGEGGATGDGGKSVRSGGKAGAASGAPSSKAKGASGCSFGTAGSKLPSTWPALVAAALAALVIRRRPRSPLIGTTGTAKARTSALGRAHKHQ